ncbi:hypothetical protein V5799_016626 [Amblyomma americanum]|uniref:Uncharacterized protein n=1 Tax=Amblyomma americanum TaxID=6943 RepID=A0AAQ4F5N5_AMBAM
MSKTNEEGTSAHGELQSRFPTSHLELRHSGGTIRFSFFKLLVTFLLFLTVLMMASGVAVSAATSWLVGSVLIVPGLLLLCFTVLVATWISGRRAAFADGGADPFAGVAYSMLAPHAADSVVGESVVHHREQQQVREARKKRNQRVHRGSGNVSFVE